MFSNYLPALPLCHVATIDVTTIMTHTCRTDAVAPTLFSNHLPALLLCHYTARPLWRFAFPEFPRHQIDDEISWGHFFFDNAGIFNYHRFLSKISPKNLVIYFIGESLCD